VSSAITFVPIRPFFIVFLNSFPFVGYNSELLVFMSKLQECKIIPVQAMKAYERVKIFALVLNIDAAVLRPRPLYLLG
jgi:hypothetical protein